jgi:hypothetical protein
MKYSSHAPATAVAIAIAAPAEQEKRGGGRNLICVEEMESSSEAGTVMHGLGSWASALLNK